MAKSEGPASYHQCLNDQLSKLGTSEAPDLSRLSPDDRQSIEVACILAKSEGPASYHQCLNGQLSKLGTSKAPDLSALSWDDRQSVEVACVLAKAEGPASYHNCLSAQLQELKRIQIPDASGLTAGDRQSIKLACTDTKTDGPATYNDCLGAQLRALAVTRSLLGKRFNTVPLKNRTTQNRSTARSVLPTYPACAENGSCFGDISERTGLPKTILVHGYFRSDGTYVRGYYRSK